VVTITPQGCSFAGAVVGISSSYCLMLRVQVVYHEVCGRLFGIFRSEIHAATRDDRSSLVVKSGPMELDNG
jgi:hypothetical protein